MSDDMKRHLISAARVFLSAFAVAVLPVITDPTWAYTGKAALISLVTAGVSAGLKAAWEKWISAPQN